MDRPDLDYSLMRFTIRYRGKPGDPWQESKWKMTAMRAAVQYAGQQWDVVPESGEMRQDEGRAMLDPSLLMGHVQRGWGK